MKAVLLIFLLSIILSGTFGGLLGRCCAGKKKEVVGFNRPIWPWSRTLPLPEPFSKDHIIVLIAEFLVPDSPDFALVLFLNKKTFQALKPMLQNRILGSYFSQNYFSAFSKYIALRATRKGAGGTIAIRNLSLSSSGNLEIDGDLGLKDEGCENFRIVLGRLRIPEIRQSFRFKGDLAVLSGLDHTGIRHDFPNKGQLEGRYEDVERKYAMGLIDVVKTDRLFLNYTIYRGDGSKYFKKCLYKYTLEPKNRFLETLELDELEVINFFDESEISESIFITEENFPILLSYAK